MASRSIEFKCTSTRHFEQLQSLGFRNAILEVENNNFVKNDEFILATRQSVSIASGFENVKQLLAKARQEVDLVSICGDNDHVLKRLADNVGNSTKDLFDILTLDLHSSTSLKPSLVQQLIREFGIVLEINLSQLFTKPNRAKLLSNARHIVRALVRKRKGHLRLILSGDSTRDANELSAIAMFIGLKEEDAKFCTSLDCATNLLRDARMRKFNCEQRVVRSRTSFVASLNKRVKLANAWT